MGSGRTFTFFWFAIALVLFAASGILTRKITVVARTAPQSGYAVFLTGDDRAPISLRADVGDDDIALHVTGKPDGSRRGILFGPVPRGSEDAVVCTDERSDARVPLQRTYEIGTAVKTDDVYQELGLPLEPANVYRVQDAYYSANNFRAWPFFEFDIPADADVDVGCRLPNDVIHETFATRALTFVVGRGGERPVKGVLSPFPTNAGPFARRPEPFFDPQSISVRDADGRDARVADETSGRELLGTVVVTSAFDADPDGADAVYRFSWESVTAGQERDIVLVVIGSLVALGAAAAIEAGRPFIESIGDRRSK